MKEWMEEHKDKDKEHCHCDCHKDHKE